MAALESLGNLLEMVDGLGPVGTRAVRSQVRKAGRTAAKRPSVRTAAQAVLSCSRPSSWWASFATSSLTPLGSRRIASAT